MIWILVILIIISIAAGISVYRSRSTKLLDRDVYKDFTAMIEDAAASEDGGIADREALTELIEDWADEHGLEYIRDYHGNIIFDKAADGRKKNVSPTLIAVSMNHLTAADNAQVLAAAAAIASSEIESGRRAVIFFNDDRCLGEGYRGLNEKYITSKTKVIYLDKGDDSYISTGSFQQRWSEISIPADREENSCDTAVRISISGIKSGIIGPGISGRPDPVSALSSILTRLKSKSVVYGIAELSIGANGNMYPDSLDVTITLNSYNLNSFTSYLDKQIREWEKDYSDSYGDITYGYEVIEDEEAVPDTVFTRETADAITGVLYTVRSGPYMYSESDAIPEGREPGDVYGINCITDIYTGYGTIYVSMVTQGVNDLFTERICNDNKTAAELYSCSYKQTDNVEAFINTRDSLSRTFMSTYERVNKSGAADMPPQPVMDDCFTPCSYLTETNSKADIIHLSMKGSDAARMANTVLCYIKAKGNTSIFK